MTGGVAVNVRLKTDAVRAWHPTKATEPSTRFGVKFVRLVGVNPADPPPSSFRSVFETKALASGQSLSKPLRS